MSSFSTTILLLALALLAACVPVKKDATCSDDEAYNTTLRACVSNAALKANNRPVIGLDQTENTTEDTPAIFSVNPASDIDGDTISYKVVSAPAAGILTDCMNKSGSAGLTDLSCTYTPSANFYGTDHFTYKASDAFHDTSSFGTVTITVAAVNDSPTVNFTMPTVAEDSTTTYTISYTDPENDLATSCNVSNLVAVTTSACSCTLQGVCTFTVTPNADANSLTTFFGFDVDVTAGATSPLLSEVLLVSPVNDLPIVVFASCTSPMAQNDPIVCGAPSVVDPDVGDTHTWSLDASNTCSWVNMTSVGVISGSPSTNDVGNCNLNYTATDSSGGTSIVSSTPMTITNVVPTVSVVGAFITPTEDAGKQVIGFVSSSPGCTDVFCVADDTVNEGTLTFGPATNCNLIGTLSFEAINADTASINFTPFTNVAQAVSCDVEVQYTDPQLAMSSALTSFTMQEVNDTPVINVATIPNQTINTGTPFVVDTVVSTASIDPLVIDEGGDFYEDTQNLTIKLHSSNTAIIPHSMSNILMYNDAAFLTSYVPGVADSTGVSYSTINGDAESLYLVVQPVVGLSGTVTLTLTITDDGTTSGSPDPKTLTKTFIVNVTNKSAVHNDWTDIYAVGSKMLFDGTVGVEPEVRLKWNAFTVFNDALTGYQVYRSVNPTGPFLTAVGSVVSPTSRAFTDTTLTFLNSGTTFYYKVKPIASNGKPMEPSSVYSTARVPIPIDNMALVHRRIANKSMCASLAKPSDKLNHNRCNYIGPGANGSYYDIGQDYFVDRFEASCNYTQSECPETAGAGCIGDGAPVATPSTPSIYYDRDSGTCYYYQATWKAVTDLDSVEILAFAELNQTKQDGSALKSPTTFPKRPPLVNIPQYKAYNYCTASTINPSYGATPKTLVSRLVHMAAAEWSPQQTNTAQLEQGSSLSLTTSQCNSSTGAHLDFEDTLISSLYDTWTATSTSAATHSYVMAGSDVTNACQSRYGIQDIVGNVEEWNVDRVHTLNGNLPASEWFAYTPIAPGLVGYGNDFIPYMLDGTYNPYVFTPTPYDYYANSFFGSTAGNPNVDYEWEAGGINKTHIYFPMGWPAQSPGASNREPTAVSGKIFNNDKVYLTGVNPSANGDYILDDYEIAGVTSGGSFANGSGSGRYTLRLRPACHDMDLNNSCADAIDIEADGTEENVYTGFRCMLPVP